MFHDKEFETVKNPNYDIYQRGLASMDYKFLTKKSVEKEQKLQLHLHEIKTQLINYTNLLSDNLVFQ